MTANLHNGLEKTLPDLNIFERFHVQIPLLGNIYLIYVMMKKNVVMWSIDMADIAQPEELSGSIYNYGFIRTM